MTSIIERLEVIIVRKQAAREAVEVRRLKMEKERLWFEKEEKAFGPGSSASVNDKEMEMKMMIKRIMSSLSRIYKEAEVVEGNNSDDVCCIGEAFLAPLSLPSPPHLSSLPSKTEAVDECDVVHVALGAEDIENQQLPPLVATEDMETQLPPSVFYIK